MDDTCANMAKCKDRYVAFVAETIAELDYFSEVRDGKAYVVAYNRIAGLEMLDCLSCEVANMPWILTFREFEFGSSELVTDRLS